MPAPILPLSTYSAGFAWWRLALQHVRARPLAWFVTGACLIGLAVVLRVTGEALSTVAPFLDLPLAVIGAAFVPGLLFALWAQLSLDGVDGVFYNFDEALRRALGREPWLLGGAWLGGFILLAAAPAALAVWLSPVPVGELLNLSRRGLLLAWVVTTWAFAVSAYLHLALSLAAFLRHDRPALPFLSALAWGNRLVWRHFPAWTAFSLPALALALAYAGTVAGLLWAFGEMHINVLALIGTVLVFTATPLTYAGFAAGFRALVPAAAELPKS